MPPRDPRLCPALERALPADSVHATGYRILREPREVLFGSGEWRQVQVRAWWRDRRERIVIQIEWHIAGETWDETYLWAAGKLRGI